jgi:hypothetical protein
MIATATVEPLAHVLGVGYVAIGVVIATLLARRGHAPGVALGAFACWPLFVSLLGEQPGRATPGPLHARIATTLLDLREAMAEPGALGLALPEDLAGLVDDLHRADERLALVDRLLASVAAGRTTTAPGVLQSTDELRRARGATAAQIEAVLDGVVQLRLQIGLRALAGNSVPVQERLRDLRGRLAAIDEIAAMELHA